MRRLFISRITIENLILGATAFLLSGALLRLISNRNTDLVLAGDRRFELALAAVYAGLVLVALVHLRPTLRAAFKTPALVALIALTCVSFYWAELPGLVARRTVGVVGATFFGVVLASRLDFYDQLKLIRRVLRITAALTVAAWAIGKAMGADLVSGDSTTSFGVPAYSSIEGWHGIFNHKNDLGAMMALAILVEWYFPAQSTVSRVARLLWLPLYGVLLLLSDSMTALASVTLAILLMYAFKAFRYQYGLLVPALLVGLLLFGGFLMLNAGSASGALKALGRSSDLSGRMELWHSVIAMIHKKPMLGYGFSGFWRGASDESAVVETQIGWSPVYAHNGYLEITLSLGVIGLLLFAWFVLTGIKRTLFLSRMAESSADLWPLAFLAFFLIHNLSECTILFQNNLEWGLCVATVVGSDPRLAFSPATESPPEELEFEPDPECA
jgi:exopolysaccharide production protein ExoQ